MQGIIDRGRYKVVEVLRRSEGYEACLCIDVTRSNDYAQKLFNIYRSKAAIREYLPMYYAMRGGEVKSFYELLTSDGSISAVFHYYNGEELSDFFKTHSKELFDEKMEYAESLLSLALELDLADERLSACALKQGNVVVDVKDRTVHFNFLADPESMKAEYTVSQRLGSMMGEIFRKDRYMPEEILDFIDMLCSDELNSCVEIYSHWRKVQETVPATRKAYEAETLFQYLKRKALRKRKEKLNKHRS